MEGDFQVGAWLIQPKLNSLTANGVTVHLEPKAMQVLLYLAEHAGDVMPKERIIQAVWADTFVTDDVLTRAISELRHTFDDDPHEPRFIQTIPKGGYRLIAPVAALTPRPSPPGRGWPAGVGEGVRRYKLAALVAAASAIIVALILGLNLAGLRDRLFPRPAPPAGKIMLVVLPFENLSGDPEQEYFSDGMTEEMTAQLGQLSPERLGVIGRASAMTYKGRKKTIDEIGKELRVQYVLEGSVRRAGERVRITAQLIEVGDQTHVWAESYDRDLRDILALQSDVAQAVAHEVQIKLTPQEQTRLASARPVKPEAYEAFLVAKHYGNYGDIKRALPYIERSIALDPTYAPAYAELGQDYIDMTSGGVRPVKDDISLAKAALGKALALDPTLADARGSLGYITFAFDWDWSGAEADLKRVNELYPNNTVAHHMYALLLNLMGRPDEALREFERRQGLDPLSTVGWGPAITMYYARRYDESIARLNKGMEVKPDFTPAKAALACNYAQKRMYPEAVAACRSAISIASEDQRVLGRCGWVYALAGRRQDALTVLDRLKRLSPHLRVDPYFVALIYDGLGNRNRAMEWLERGYQERSHQMPYTKIEFWSDRLRADPRFQDLLRRMNFPP